MSVTGEQTSADGRLVIMTGPSTKPVTVTNADGQRLKNVHWDEAARRLTVRLAEAGVHTVVIER